MDLNGQASKFTMSGITFATLAVDLPQLGLKKGSAIVVAIALPELAPNAEVAGILYRQDIAVLVPKLTEWLAQVPE
jgi:hypothetical protein